MVLPLLTLPEELQAHFVLLLADVMTAGRLARSSRACKRLVQHRLAALVEAKRNELRERQQPQSTDCTGQALGGLRSARTLRGWMPPLIFAIAAGAPALLQQEQRSQRRIVLVQLFW